MTVGRLEEVGVVVFRGLADRSNLSGIAAVGDGFVVADDECGSLCVLNRTDERGAYICDGVIPLHHAPDGERDIESVAWDGSRLYAAGSHSLVRRSVKPNKTSNQNRKRFRRVRRDARRDYLVRLQLTMGPSLKVEMDAPLNLRPLLSNDPILEPFTHIPGKENGVDIEGIAAVEGRLFLGCRGPVLRHGFVPVLVLDFDDPTSYELRLIQLGGRGIRDMNATENGFLILAGPVASGPGDFRMYAWDGTDGIGGSDRSAIHPIPLGVVPDRRGSCPEGFVVMAEHEDHFEVLMVFDGVHGGDPRVFRVPRR